MSGKLKCKMIRLKQVDGVDRSLVFMEGFKEIPFEIKRVFYIFDNPNIALNVPHMTWVKTLDFENGSALLALTNREYGKYQYYEDFKEYERII